VTTVLILGAHGQIARVVTELFVDKTDAQLTLYLWDAGRLGHLDGTERMRVVEGDVRDMKTLEVAIQRQDVVYANLAGRLEEQAKCIVKAMDNAGVKRLIFISSMGIYDEIPGERHGSPSGPVPQRGPYHRGFRSRLYDPQTRLAG